MAELKKKITLLPKFQKDRYIKEPDPAKSQISPGGYPVSEAERNIYEQREKYVEPWSKPIEKTFGRIWRRAGDKLLPGTPLMDHYRHKNVLEDEQEAADKMRQQRRKKNSKEDVRARIGEMGQQGITAFKKSEAAGAPNPAILDRTREAIRQMIIQSGYAPQEFGIGTSIEEVNYDPFQLRSNRPNPFPEIQIASEVAGSIGGSYAGLMAGARLGATLPLPGLAKFIATVAGGGLGVAMSYFGYERGLDLWNNAQKSKAYLEGKDVNTYTINRPSMKERSQRAADLAVIDMLLGGIVMGVRPMYNVTRNLSRRVLGGVGETGQKTLIGTEELLKKYNVTLPTQRGWWGITNSGREMVPGEATGTLLSTAALSDYAFVGGIPQTLGRFPIIGGGIVNNLELQSKILIDLWDNMFTRYAPTMTTRGLGLNMLGSKRKVAEKFMAEADLRLNAFRSYAKSKGIVLDTTTIKNTTEGIMDSIRQKSRLQTAKWEGTDVIDLSAKPNLQFPRGTEDFYNFVNDIYLNLSKTSKWQLQQLEGFFDDLGRYAQKYKSDNKILSEIAEMKKSTEAALSGFDGEAAKLWKEYDDFVANGMILFDSPFAKQFGRVEKNGFDLRLAEQGPVAADDLYRVAFKSMDKSAMIAAKNLLGPDVFNQTTRHFFEEAFEASLKENKRGVKAFDMRTFRKILGLDAKGGNTYEAVKEMFPGPSPSPAGGFIPKTPTKAGVFGEDLFEPVTLKRGEAIGAEAPMGGRVEFEDITAVGNKWKGPADDTMPLPTLDDIEKWANAVDAVFKYGIPDISTFIARRAQISGLRGAIKAFMPFMGPGAGKVSAAAASGTAAGAGAGTVVGGMGAGSMFGAIAGSLLTRHLGKIVTNPINMRVYRNAIDFKLPERLRNKAIIKFFQVFGEEINELDKELAQMEEAAIRKETLDSVKGGAAATIVKEGLKDVKEGIGGVIESIKPDWMGQQSRVQMPTQLPTTGETEVATAGFGGGTPAPGSILRGTSQLNAPAAQALYTGDTDAALAAQYASEGGLMSIRR